MGIHHIEHIDNDTAGHVLFVNPIGGCAIVAPGQVKSMQSIIPGTPQSATKEGLAVSSSKGVFFLRAWDYNLWGRWEWEETDRVITPVKVGDEFMLEVQQDGDVQLHKVTAEVNHRVASRAR